MRKIYYILIFLFLFSCSQDEIDVIIDEPIVVSNIFDKEENIVTNEMDLVFDIPSDGTYYLVITQDGSVVSKEKFTATLGKTNHTIYTKSLLNQKYTLILQNEDKIELQKTFIVIEK